MCLGHRIAIMNGGRIEQVGTPAEVYDRPATLFAPRFIGTPAMNLIPRRARPTARCARRAASRSPRRGLERPRGRRGRAARGPRLVARSGPSPRGWWTRTAGRRRRLRDRGRGRDWRVRMPPATRLAAGAPVGVRPRARRRRSRPDTRGGAGRGRDPASNGAPQVLRRRAGARRRLASRARRRCFVVLGPTGRGQDDAAARDRRPREARRGHVHLDGLDVTARHAGGARRGHGVPELLALPALIGARNIASPLRAPGAPSADEIDARVGWAAELLRIERAARPPPAQLSGGEMQRVAIGARARAPAARVPDGRAAHQPRRSSCARSCASSSCAPPRRSGRTLLYVTHDQAEALSMADRIAVLPAGAVQQVGAPREIYERPVNRWVAGFIGSPRMNLLPCRPEGPELVGEQAGRFRGRPGRRASPGARCCSASARKTSRWSGAARRRRSAASSTRSSRWATARWSTSTSAAR